MKIYSDTILENTLLAEEAVQLKAGGFISRDQFETIKTNLPGLKSQNSILIRLGLFLLGGILYISLCGACSLLLLENHSEGFLKFIVFLFAVIGFAGAEFMVRDRKYYGYGLEEAFILGGQISFVIFIRMVNANHYGYGEDNLPLSVPLAMAFIGFISALRYINLLSVIVAFTGAVWTMVHFFTYTVYPGYLFLPLVLMVFAGVFYYLSDKIYNRLEQPYYSQSMMLVNSLSLLLFYLSGNTWIVYDWLRSLVNHNNYPAEGPQGSVISLFFWLFTFAVPAVYIYFSLIKKSRVMFWVGCLALAGSFVTFRVYYQVLPLEYALSVGGILLFTITLIAVRKLRNKEEGITFKPDRINDKDALMNAETLLVTSQLGMKPLDDPDESKPFSGGEGFNGGGSGGNF